LGLTFTERFVELLLIALLDRLLVLLVWILVFVLGFVGINFNMFGTRCGGKVWCHWLFMLLVNQRRGFTARETEARRMGHSWLTVPETSPVKLAGDLLWFTLLLSSRFLRRRFRNRNSLVVVGRILLRQIRRSINTPPRPVIGGWAIQPDKAEPWPGELKGRSWKNLRKPICRLLASR
jgi:hypothetical protein